MVYIYIFFVFHIIIQQKHYHSDLKKSYCYLGMDDTEKYRPEEMFCKRRISGFLVGDETQIRVGKEYFFWIWIAIEPVNKLILDIYLSAAEKNMFVAEKFLHSLIKEYGKHQIPTDIVVHDIHYMFVN